MPIRLLCILIPLLLVSPAISNEKPFTLDDAYHAALTTNEIVKIGEEDVLQAKSRVDQALTYLFPRVTARGGFTRYNEMLPPEGGAFIFQPREQTQAVVELNQPLFTGGRTMAAYRYAKTQSTMMQKQFSASQQDVLLNVGNAYFEVLKSKRLVDVSRDSLSRMEQYKKVTERVASTRKTKATASDLLRARTLVSQSEVLLLVAEDRFMIARQRLSLLTRIPENSVFTEPDPQPLPGNTLEQLKQTALASRDEYARSRLNQTAAKEAITIVKGGHWPQLSAVGGFQYTDSYPATGLDGRNYYAGLRLQISLFEGGLMRAEMSEARSRYRQAELATEQLRRSIEQDVTEAYIVLQTQTTVLERTKQQYTDANENFRTIAALFNEGLISSLAVIDAQQALFVSEREYVNALYDQQIAILRLQRATGLLGKNTKSLNEGFHASS